MRIFIDTGAWMGYEIKNDQHHGEASAYFKKAKKDRALFYTNSYVLAETYTRLIYDLHLKAAEIFHEHVLSSVEKHQLVVLEIVPEDRQRAFEILKKFSDHKLSFTDATIVANFYEYHLDEVFTFDKHFKDIGLPTNLE